MHPVVLAMTGASGAPYAVRLLEVLIRQGQVVHLVVSDAGKTVIRHETGMALSKRREPGCWGEWAEVAAADGQLVWHDQRDFLTPIASGSFLTAGMIVCPCSGSTLSAVATGVGHNLVHRAAEVHLKERRPLVLVTRETPLSLVAIRNMAAATEAGATVLPASPGWYHRVAEPSDLVDFIVARILDQLAVPHRLCERWEGGDV